jgi:hypothetical protein
MKKVMCKRLVVSSETVRNLGTTQLGWAVGGARAPIPTTNPSRLLGGCNTIPPTQSPIISIISDLP